MSILFHLNNLEATTIYKLCFNDKVVGLRVKYYSLEDKTFYYYDFESSYVKRQDLRDFLNKHSREFENLKLIEYNGLVCTHDEIDGKISVQEFKDEKNAEAVLDSVIKVIEGRCL